MGANMHRYFNNDKFSDITLRVNGEDVKAHKLVLAQGSDYFKACFDGGFKEASGGILWLYGDDTHAVKRLIKHLYGYSYEGYSAEAIQASAESSSGPKSFVALYAVGQKYLVPAVCTQAKASFAAILDAMPSTERYAESFADVVKHVYITYELEATEFRELLQKHFIERVADVADLDDFKGLFTDIPEFAFDVTASLIRLTREMAGVTKKQGPGKKRKRLTLR